MRRSLKTSLFAAAVSSPLRLSSAHHFSINTWVAWKSGQPSSAAYPEKPYLIREPRCGLLRVRSAGFSLAALLTSIANILPCSIQRSAGEYLTKTV